jgi:hypothetical protein
MQTLRSIAAAALGVIALPMLALAQSGDSPKATTVPVTNTLAGLMAETYFACYIPGSGTLYRIKTLNAPTTCSKSTHVEFNWNNMGPEGPMGPMGPAGMLKLPFDTVMSYTGPVLLVRNSNISSASSAAQFSGGSGRGVYGTSNSGAGVHGLTPFVGTGVGVRAEAVPTTGTALEITRGAIRVAGAGKNTATTAFRTGFLTLTAGTHTMTLDNPLINYDPDAILMVTMGEVTNGALNGHFVYYQNGFWKIRYKVEADGGLTDYSPPAGYFNVLVIKTK